MLHSGNYKDCGYTDPPENVVIHSVPLLGKAASYAGLLTAGAATADSVLVTPCPNGVDKESDAQARSVLCGVPRLPVHFRRIRARCCRQPGAPATCTLIGLVSPHPKPKLYPKP